MDTVTDWLKMRYPQHEMSEPKRIGTSYRIIMTCPPDSKALAITDTLLATGLNHPDDIRTMMLDRGVFAALDAANNADVVFVTGDGVETRRSDV